MPSHTQRKEKEQRDRQRTQRIVEDERGWAGQHGQRPANEEEKNPGGAKPATASSPGKGFPKQ